LKDANITAVPVSLNHNCRELTPELKVLADNLLVILADLQR